jgi:hypothetical protein
MVSEVSSGAQFSRSGIPGVVADSLTRVFRVMMAEAGEPLDIQGACGVQIGDQHPSNTEIFCQSFSAAYEGESRMVIVCTFQYGTKETSGGGQEPSLMMPDVRPANWTTSTSLMEAPVYAWYEIKSDGAPKWKTPQPAANPVGDRYDGITRLEPIVTINIEQYEPLDPTRHVMHAGSVNSNEFTLGSLSCNRASVMFRGVQTKPHVEAFGTRIWRGWMASYEFAFRRNTAPYIYYGIDKEDDQDIGWDIAVPLTGFNVRAINPANPQLRDDVFAQPLKHSGGKIATPLALFDNVDVGDKVRAMVKVFEYENGGASQIPSAQPVPLNFNGNPLKVVSDDGEFANPVIIKRYRVAPEIDFTEVLGLRLT